VARTRNDEPDEDEDEDWEEEDYDPEDPETYPSGLYDDDGPATVPCPYCKAEIIEDSEQCPKCGEYISKEDSSPAMSWWVWILAVLLLLTFTFMAIGRD